ncbi:MAG: hypothetical protein LBH40_05865 [Alphaproteobacteria bacterium]|jgi:hypothetical protein|nr:hypothetical protein [Alphaproteobacteria bacterium]
MRYCIIIVTLAILTTNLYAKNIKLACDDIVGSSVRVAYSDGKKEVYKDSISGGLEIELSGDGMYVDGQKYNYLSSNDKRNNDFFVSAGWFNDVSQGVYTLSGSMGTVATKGLTLTYTNTRSTSDFVSTSALIGSCKIKDN